MAYRNKTYVAFDADSDIHNYFLMKAWKQSDNSLFNFHDAHDVNNIWGKSSEETIKRRLRERMNNSKVFVLLIGESTKHLYKYVRWEVEQAHKRNLPIIAVNLNQYISVDLDRIPPIVRDGLSISIPFKSKALQFALDDWPPFHQQTIKTGGTGYYKYEQSHYENFGFQIKNNHIV